MALKVRIKTEDDNLIHFDTLKNDYTLCGLETGGDGGLNIKRGVRTKKKVNCQDCIDIVKFCSLINRNEFE